MQDLAKRTAGSPLSEAELEQRRAAAKARWAAVGAGAGAAAAAAVLTHNEIVQTRAAAAGDIRSKRPVIAAAERLNTRRASRHALTASLLRENLKPHEGSAFVDHAIRTGASQLRREQADTRAEFAEHAVDRVMGDGTAVRVVPEEVGINGLLAREEHLSDRLDDLRTNGRGARRVTVAGTTSKPATAHQRTIRGRRTAEWEAGADEMYAHLREKLGLAPVAAPAPVESEIDSPTPGRRRPSGPQALRNRKEWHRAVVEQIVSPSEDMAMHYASAEDVRHFLRRHNSLDGIGASLHEMPAGDRAGFLEAYGLPKMVLTRQPRTVDVSAGRARTTLDHHRKVDGYPDRATRRSLSEELTRDVQRRTDDWKTAELGRGAARVAGARQSARQAALASYKRLALLRHARTRLGLIAGAAGVAGAAAGLGTWFAARANLHSGAANSHVEKLAKVEEARDRNGRWIAAGAATAAASGAGGAVLAVRAEQVRPLSRNLQASRGGTKPPNVDVKGVGPVTFHAQKMHWIDHVRRSRGSKDGLSGQQIDSLIDGMPKVVRHGKVLQRGKYFANGERIVMQHGRQRVVLQQRGKNPAFRPITTYYDHDYRSLLQRIALKARRLLHKDAGAGSLAKAFQHALPPSPNAAHWAAEGDKPRVTVLIGKPGSGKSTWRAIGMARDAVRPTVVVSTDAHVEDVGRQLGLGFSEAFKHVDHDQVDRAQRAQIRAAVRAGHDIIIDKVNASPRSRAKTLRGIPARYERHAVILTAPAAELARRRSMRAGKEIPKAALRHMNERWTLPTPGEFDVVHHVDTRRKLGKAAPPESTPPPDSTPAEAALSRRLATLFGKWTDEAEERILQPSATTMHADMLDGLDRAMQPLDQVVRAGVTAPIGVETGEGGQNIAFTLKARSPDVATYVDQYRQNRIAALAEEQKDTIKAQLIDAALAGASPQAMATRIKQTIGLTPYQAGHVVNYMRELEELNPAALQRALRDKRYDKKVQRALEDGTVLSADEIQKMGDAYHRRYLAYRATTIARTEAVGAANNGQAAAAAALEQAQPDFEIEKEWIATRDEKTRHDHWELNGQVVRGLDTPFVCESGDEVRWPHDPKAPARQVINCRCAWVTRLVPRIAAGP